MSSSGVVAGVLGIALAVVCVAPSLAFDHPDKPFAHPEWADWFAKQSTPDEHRYSCCNQSDGHILDDDDVRIVGNDYEVKTEHGWLRFPNTGQGQPGNTVLGFNDNPTGHSVAWWSGARAICFAEGTGT